MKTTLKINYIAAAMAICLVSAGCVKNFVEINTNPNNSNTASPQSLIGPLLLSTLNNTLTRNFRINNELMQVTVTTADSREFHRYEIRPAESEYMWRNWYLALTNVRDIYTSAAAGQQPGYQTYQGISLILDAWISSLLTDMFGDVPYFDSNKGRDFIITAKFDAQPAIYADLFQKLDSANQLLKLGALPETDDVRALDPIYNTDPNLWRRFGNSLYLRLLLRVAHKEELDAIDKIKEMIDINPGEYPLFRSNADNAILLYTGQQPYITAFHTARDFDFNGDKGYAEFFINNLLTLNDPRLPILATQATLGVYSGMQSGYPRGSVPQRESTLHAPMKSNSRLGGNMMNYGELQLLLAEAALKGYIDKDPTAYYRNGVYAGVEFWDAEIDDTYFDNPAANFAEADTDNEKLKMIHFQKYLTLLFTDFQQWYEYRRTGALDLYRGPGLENNGQMPSRLNYPIIVQSLNKANYDAAVAAMGGDSINEKVWWQRQ
ncbi:SusD/RagB family nutrient-binding outer membrane lipoprotein [Parapedobacter deserti]|uniref:SusD/RagB family nutrient-binding outer membrane lipoprotein n=1 Tax=Parapedobacter deserti TaxID=1912957 RepID=A0ABV7JJJ5_9SPHI